MGGGCRRLSRLHFSTGCEALARLPLYVTDNKAPNKVMLGRSVAYRSIVQIHIAPFKQSDESSKTAKRTTPRGRHSSECDHEPHSKKREEKKRWPPSRTFGLDTQYLIHSLSLAIYTVLLAAAASSSATAGGADGDHLHLQKHIYTRATVRRHAFISLWLFVT